MLKGVQHRIIEINETGNPYFERALLFVRSDYRDRAEEELTAVAQCYTRRTPVYSTLREHRAIRWYKRCVLVLLGAVFGAVVGLLLPWVG